MPAIPDEYLDCVVFLYASERHAEEGNTERGGTGFLVTVPMREGDEDGPRATYVVTNWHCAKHTPTLRFNIRDGGTKTLTPAAGAWVHWEDERDDVAAFMVEPGAAYQYSAVPLTVADPEQEAPPGTDVFFAGRYVTMSGVAKNTPMVRFGNVAMATQEPIRRRDGKYQDSILVEARSRGGFSGSPVFTFTLAVTSFVTDPIAVGHARLGPPQLLGIVWGHHDEPAPVLGPDKETPIEPRAWVKTNTVLAYVVPSAKIAELLNRPEERQVREDKAKEIAAEAATEDYATDDEDRVSLAPLEPDEALRALLQTPPAKE
ncbi:MAG: serine protease [Actinomycetes bacterium]